ncbi:MAG: molybdenum cofactor guanylyltransferase [Pelagibacteraceae bacterium TMED268]|nr:MAG: molybdenum cofactor guanylyltransferase [Pelagibacteraceae bacterium TMED268]|tara:strand:- start:304 stop:924 length:621 start_codon:yes stop_codon:yes gene_type:complete
MNDNNILAVILAGGKSKRFGEDKNLVKLGSLSLIEHVIQKVKEKFKKILIIANNDLKIEKSSDIVVIPDLIKGNLGPLIGILTAMKWAKKSNSNYKWIATFPSDTPFFDISIIEKYEKKIIEDDSLLYFVTSSEKRHNIFGLWSIDLLDVLEEDLLKNNFRKVEDWANKIGVKTINIKFEKFDPFLNINTKEDLSKAEKIFKDYKK